MSDTERMTPNLITAEAAGEILGVSGKTVLRRTESGEITPAVDRGLGRPKYLYERSEIVALAKAEHDKAVAEYAARIKAVA